MTPAISAPKAERAITSTVVFNNKLNPSTFYLFSIKILMGIVFASWLIICISKVRKTLVQPSTPNLEEEKDHADE